MSSLPLFILFPIAGAFLSFAPFRFNRIFLVLWSLLPLLLLFFGNEQTITMPWISALSIQFSLKMDGISRLFLYLTSIVIPLVIFTAKEESSLGWVFLTQGLLAGFFLANDLVLFTLFWESMLLPIFFLLLIYGGSGRQRASMRFLIYMLAGSCLLIASILALYLTSTPHTFSMEQLALHKGSFAPWVLAIFLLAFAVKTPLFPFHAWLPDAYAEASTSGTIVLSALLSKAGIYGIYRIGYGFFPELMATYSLPLLGLAIFGVLYGGFVAWRQMDFKRLIAYSSFSHVNFILAGLFATQAIAHQGAMIQVFNHGITITALFLLCGWLADRLSSYSLNAGGGLATLMPQMAWSALFFTLASVALPGTSNFIGEVLILFGIFLQNYWLTALLGLSLILSAAYMLRFYHHLFFGPTKGVNHKLADLSKSEWAPFLVLIFLVLLIGLYPSVLLKMIEGIL